VKTLFKNSTLLYCLLFAPIITAQVLIVHPQNTAAELSRNDLRAIFAMRIPHWPDGTTIQVFVLEDKNTVHISFCKHLLGIFPYQLRRIWDRQVFSGTGISPTTVKTEQEMREQVAKTKGAIGYIRPEKVDASIKTIEAIK